MKGYVVPASVGPRKKHSMSVCDRFVPLKKPRSSPEETSLRGQRREEKKRQKKDKNLKLIALLGDQKDGRRTGSCRGNVIFYGCAFANMARRSPLLALRNLLRNCELFARLLTVSFCARVSSRLAELLHKASGGQDDDQDHIKGRKGPRSETPGTRFCETTSAHIWNVCFSAHLQTIRWITAVKMCNI